MTRAKGEGNGNFYHIKVIDSPFHMIPFVSCFISLINNMKKKIILFKNSMHDCDDLRGLNFAGQSIFTFF